jgi:hypothetical protein
MDTIVLIGLLGELLFFGPAGAKAEALTAGLALWGLYESRQFKQLGEYFSRIADDMDIEGINCIKLEAKPLLRPLSIIGIVVNEEREFFVAFLYAGGLTALEIAAPGTIDQLIPGFVRGRRASCSNNNGC